MPKRSASRPGHTKQLEFEPPVAEFGARLYSATAALVELQYVNVLEVESLGFVNRHHLDGIVDRLARATLLSLAALSDILAQRAQDCLRVTFPVPQHGVQVSEEAVEVGKPVGTQIAGRFGHLEEK